MHCRQPPIPSVWLMTDERMGNLPSALARLPRGAGIVFRHHATPPRERRALFDRVRVVARQRGLVLVLAGTAGQAAAWRADGVHARRAGRVARPLLRTAPAHDAREVVAAARAGAGAAFLSPVFATRSHPGAPVLGPARFGSLARGAGMIVIALGGMDARRFRRLRGLGAAGWAAIDAWDREAPCPRT